MKTKDEVISRIRNASFYEEPYNMLNDMQAERIYNLMQKHFNGWIPVSERLPDVGDDVLAILEHWHTKNKKQRVISRVNASDYEWELDGCEISHDWNVSCWQPLPEDKS